MTNEEQATLPVLIRHSSFGIGHSFVIRAS